MEQELEVGKPCSVDYVAYLEELFPLALVWGMTPHQYWQEDCSLTKAYKEKYEIERKIENEKLWLQGTYVYIAMCKVAPLYCIKPSRPDEYLKEPIPLTEHDKKVQDEREQGERIAEYMNAYMANFNKGGD